MSSSFPRCIPRIGPASMRPFNGRSIPSRGRYNIQFRTVGATDGHLRWLHCRGRAFFDERGRVYRFLGITQDITQLVEARQQRGSSEALFANLIKVTPAATAVFTERDMQIQQVNTPMLAIWGKDDSVIGKSMINEGHIYGVINTAIDVSEQVLARQQLAQSEARDCTAKRICQYGYWVSHL